MVGLIVKLVLLLFLAVQLALTYPHEEEAAENSTHSSTETPSTPIFGLAPEAEREGRDVSGEHSTYHPTTQVTAERKKREEIELGDEDEERKEPESPDQALMNNENGTTAGSKEGNEATTTKAVETSGEHGKKEKREAGSKEVEATTERAHKEKREVHSKEVEEAKKERREVGSKETEHNKKENRGAGNKRAVRGERNANINHKNRPVKTSHVPTKPDSDPHP